MTQKNIKLSQELEELLPNMFQDFSDKKQYCENTNDIQVSVRPEFVDGQASASGHLFVWIYHIKIENKSLENIKLINRHWKIIDEKGDVQEVDGEGVVGEQPLISPGAKFQYSSGVHLRQPSGIMTGTYEMQQDDGSTFTVKIPTFSLDVPSIKGNVN